MQGRKKRINARRRNKILRDSMVPGCNLAITHIDTPMKNLSS